MPTTTTDPADAPLASAFLAFAAFGARREAGPPPTLATARLDGAAFAKMARDSGLLVGRGGGGGGGGCAPASARAGLLTPAAVDLAFKAACNGSGGDGRRIAWAGFLQALETLAGKKVSREKGAKFRHACPGRGGRGGQQARAFTRNGRLSLNSQHSRASPWPT